MSLTARNTTADRIGTGNASSVCVRKSSATAIAADATTSDSGERARLRVHGRLRHAARRRVAVHQGRREIAGAEGQQLAVRVEAVAAAPEGPRGADVLHEREQEAAERERQHERRTSRSPTFGTPSDGSPAGIRPTTCTPCACRSSSTPDATIDAMTTSSATGRAGSSPSERQQHDPGDADRERVAVGLAEARRELADEAGTAPSSSRRCRAASAAASRR